MNKTCAMLLSLAIPALAALVLTAAATVAVADEAYFHGSISRVPPEAMGRRFRCRQRPDGGNALWPASQRDACRQPLPAVPPAGQPRDRARPGPVRARAAADHPRKRLRRGHGLLPRQGQGAGLSGHHSRPTRSIPACSSTSTRRRPARSPITSGPRTSRPAKSSSAGATSAGSSSAGCSSPAPTTSSPLELTGPVAAELEFPAGRPQAHPVATGAFGRVGDVPQRLRQGQRRLRRRGADHLAGTKAATSSC